MAMASIHMPALEFRQRNSNTRGGASAIEGHQSTKSCKHSRAVRTKKIAKEAHTSLTPLVTFHREDASTSNAQVKLVTHPFSKGRKKTSGASLEALWRSSEHISMVHIHVTRVKAQ